MPQISTLSNDNPEFARVIEVAKLRGLHEFAFDLAPTPTEAAALARLMDAQAVKKLRFKGLLLMAPKGGWQLDGRLAATVIQTCVVTLDPVTTRIDAPVRLRFVPRTAPHAAASPGARVAEVTVMPLEDDEIEPLEEHIDLGLVAIEALALALPAYPRRAGAAIGGDGIAGPAGAAHAGDEVKPFAALAALRDKLGSGS